MPYPEIRTAGGKSLECVGVYHHRCQVPCTHNGSLTEINRIMLAGERLKNTCYSRQSNFSNEKLRQFSWRIFRDFNRKKVNMLSHLRLV